MESLSDLMSDKLEAIIKEIACGEFDWRKKIENKKVTGLLGENLFENFIMQKFPHYFTGTLKVLLLPNF